MAGTPRCLKGLRTSTLPATSRAFSTTSSSMAPMPAVQNLVNDLVRESSTRSSPEDMRKFINNTGAQFANQLQTGRRDEQKTQLETSRLKELSRTIRRSWNTGDVYAPHDLSGEEAKKWSKAKAPSHDVFDQLALNPLNEWKNPSMMFEFQSSMGKIMKRSDTGLRPVNQRRVARAIRRAIGMGFIPSVHAHPELLRRITQGGYRT